MCLTRRILFAFLSAVFIACGSLPSDTTAVEVEQATTGDTVVDSRDSRPGEKLPVDPDQNTEKSEKANKGKRGITLTLDKERDFPVTIGVPFAAGRLRNPSRLGLFDEQGRRLQLQSRILSRWQDEAGGARFVLVDFQPHGNESRSYFLRRLEPDAPLPEGSTNLKVILSEAAIDVNTGPLRFRVTKEDAHLISRIRLTSQVETRKLGAAAAPILKGGGRTDWGKIQEIELLESGPIRARIHVRGTLGENGAGYTATLDAFAGKPYVAVAFTFENQATVDLQIKELAIRFRPATGRTLQSCRLGDSDFEPGEESFVLYQKSVNSYEGSVKGKRFDDPVVWEDAGARTTLIVEDFWQNYPKSVEVRESQVKIGLSPEMAGPIAWRHGAYKTTRFLIGFEPVEHETKDEFAEYKKRRYVGIDNEYVCSTEALGPLAPRSTRHHRGYEALWEKAGGVLDRFLSDRQKMPERFYGWIHFGDWAFDGGYGNLEYDTAWSFLIQYLRTADPDYLEFADHQVLHWMDLDIFRKPGDKWDGLPLVHADTGGWHGWFSNSEHVQIGGLLLYYHLTGEERAKEIALAGADQLVQRVCPESCLPSGLWRNAGYPLLVLSQAYEFTGDVEYRRMAETVLDRMKAQRDDRDGIWFGNYGDYKATFIWQVSLLALPLYEWYPHLDPERQEFIRSSLVSMADWFRKHAFIERSAGFWAQVGRTNEGEYFGDARTFPNSKPLVLGGTVYTSHMALLTLPVFAYASMITGDNSYLEFADKELYQPNVRRASLHDGKARSQAVRFLPQYLAMREDLPRWNHFMNK